VKADPAVQLRLLDLQAVDIELAQLEHRRRNLPEHAEVATLSAQREEKETALVRVRTEVQDLERAQKRLDADIDTVRARAARDQERLDSGAVRSARDLESLQSELASLARRQSNLEDQLLELMEQVETLGGTTSELAAEHQRIVDREVEVSARRDAVLAEIDATSAARRATRDQIAAEIPADLMALYEKIRTDSGVGAAPLRRRRCEGCHLELSGGDVAVVRAAAPDEVLRCEECRRILVRTPESGL
jgi:predicted  nucleic acid-binding Zn-ribbon protein